MRNWLRNRGKERSLPPVLIVDRALLRASTDVIVARIVWVLVVFAPLRLVAAPVRLRQLRAARLEPVAPAQRPLPSLLPSFGPLGPLVIRRVLAGLIFLALLEDVGK